MTMLTGRSLALAATALLFALPDTSHAAQPYFEGKRINMTISNTPGGGMDLIARHVANLLPKYIEGKPSIIAVNRPGGGHVTGNNWFQEQAKRDGTDMLFTASSIIDEYNGGGDRIKFDPQKYDYIGAIKYASSVAMIRPEAQKRLKDPKAEPVVVGDTDGARVHTAMTVMAKRYLGDNFRWLIGYKGGNELVLAMQKGEIDVWGSKNQGELDKLMVTTKTAVPLYQSGRQRRPDYPDVPTIWELIANKNVPHNEMRAFDFWLATEPLDHIVAYPPSTDPQAVKIVRDAYLKLGKDEEFLKLVEAVNGKLISPISGEETRKLMVDSTTVNQEDRKELTAIRAEYGINIDKQ
jgi:tripartite-type tricarboxylate transporter receptor subunit TctC